MPALLAPIIANIFNKITETGKWPDLWKIEYVTVIPKNKSPHDPADCRNIACTNFLSKLYEAFTLQWTREDVRPKKNQYGGEPSASSTQLLIEVLSDVTSAMEDNRAGVVLSAIDFSKTFNRLDHLKCLQAFARKGSSSEILRLLGSFLSGRRMTVRVGDQRSDMLTVNAGAPQGSVLGCYLFNIGIDDLEEGFEQDTAADRQKEAHEETLTRSDDFPAVSTPTRVGVFRQEPHHSPVPSLQCQQFMLLPRVANAPPWIEKPKDPHFKQTCPKTYKYVDDQVNTSVVNMRKAKLLVEDNVFFKEIVDLQSQQLLNHIAKKAEDRGMAINAKKTSLMLVSASTSFDARVRVDIGAETIRGTDTLKILGVTLDRDASFKTHTTNLAKKLRQRTWALTKLRKKGLSENDLVKTYKCLIRPTAEYASPSWHSSLTATQSAELERQQTQALKNIYGPGISANKMRLRSDLDTLAKRRETAAKKFATKAAMNPRSAEWFIERRSPVYARRSGVNYPKYQEQTARTDRHRNSPKNYLVRLLNQ